MVIGLEEVGFSGLAGGVAKIWTLGFATFEFLSIRNSFKQPLCFFGLINLFSRTLQDNN